MYVEYDIQRYVLRYLMVANHNDWLAHAP